MNKIEKQLNEIEQCISKILKKRPSQVFYTKKVFSAPAVFITEDNSIRINSDNFSIMDASLVMELAHESRHSYQSQVVNGDIVNEDSVFIKIWRKQLLNPKPTPKHTSPIEVIKDYSLQEIEIDAVAFAEMFVQKYVDTSIRINIPDWLRVEVDKRKKEIKTV